MYKIILWIIIGFVCAIWWYMVVDKYDLLSVFDKYNNTKEMMTDDMVSDYLSITGDILSWNMSDEQIVNIAVGWSLITGEDADTTPKVSEQWDTYGKELSQTYGWYIDHIKEFIRLNPSSWNIPEDAIWCDIYTGMLSPIQQELYNKLTPYYDIKTDRWLVDIRSQRSGYTDEDMGKVQQYIQVQKAQKQELEQYLSQPDKYYVKKELWNWYRNNEWPYSDYSLHVYDLKKNVISLTDDALQGIQKNKQQNNRWFWWIQDMSHAAPISFYDLEAIQRYVKTFTPECYPSNVWQAPLYRSNTIDIQKIIDDLGAYGRWETEQLTVQPDRFKDSDIKVREYINNGFIWFAYGSWDNRAIIRNNPITLFYATIHDNKIYAIREQKRSEMWFYFSEDPNDAAAVEYHKWRLVWLNPKINGRYPRIISMQWCRDIIPLMRQWKNPTSKALADCTNTMGTYIDSIIQWVHSSDYITTALESLKQNIAIPR